MTNKVTKTEQQWREQLDPDTYHVTREKGTEYPGTGEFLHHDKEGNYYCVCCGEHLFTSEQKFDSGCGWPSFDNNVGDSVEFYKDTSHGMIRIEITCAKCESHLGHIFDDGPTETGKRYCVNSLSLTFSE